MDGAAAIVTYDGDDQPEEDRRENHDPIETPSFRCLVPLNIDGDDDKRNKDAYLMI